MRRAIARTGLETGGSRAPRSVQNMRGRDESPAAVMKSGDARVRHTPGALTGLPASRSTLGDDAVPTGVPAVEFDRVSIAFDDLVVLRDLSFRVEQGRMRILLGASGSGKSVVLKLTLGLLRPDAGRIFVNGRRIDTLSERELLGLRADIGMLFQESALFDSLTVGENVGYRLAEETDMPQADVDRRVQDVLQFVGLGEYGDRMPSQLSGGQRRRVALARAMASKPSLLLLDDPTVGLDPIIATTVTDEIIKVRDLERVAAIVVTHQIRDAHYVATHRAVRGADGVAIVPDEGPGPPGADFFVLHEGRIHFEGSADELLSSKDPFLEDFLAMTLPPW
jgi:phospholipid/cholesterol/gamma-HCH transport system ATP-binding protein